MKGCKPSRIALCALALVLALCCSAVALARDEDERWPKPYEKFLKKNFSARKNGFFFLANASSYDAPELYYGSLDAKTAKTYICAAYYKNGRVIRSNRRIEIRNRLADWIEVQFRARGDDEFFWTVTSTGDYECWNLIELSFGGPNGNTFTPNMRFHIDDDGYYDGDKRVDFEGYYEAMNEYEKRYPYVYANYNWVAYPKSKSRVVSAYRMALELYAQNFLD